MLQPSRKRAASCGLSARWEYALVSLFLWVGCPGDISATVVWWRRLRRCYVHRQNAFGYAFHKKISVIRIETAWVIRITHRLLSNKLSSISFMNRDSRSFASRKEVISTGHKEFLLLWIHESVVAPASIFRWSSWWESRQETQLWTQAPRRSCMFEKRSYLLHFPYPH